MRKHLTLEMWESLRNHTTATAGWTLARSINPGCVNEDSKIGVAAGDLETYVDFAPIFDPIIEEYHGALRHVADMDPGKLTNEIKEIARVKSCRVRLARNLAGFPLNSASTTKQLLEIEDIVMEACKTLEGDLAGDYHPLSSLSDKLRKELVNKHLLFKGGDRFHAAMGLNRSWPDGRGIFLNKDRTFLIWVNEEDHLRLISMQDGCNLKAVYQRLVRATECISEAIKKITGKEEAFLSSDRLGMITCCPTNLGTGLRCSVHIEVPRGLKGKALEEVEELAREMGCQTRGTHGEHSRVDKFLDISNRQRLGKPEYELVHNLIYCVNTLLGSEALARK